MQMPDELLNPELSLTITPKRVTTARGVVEYAEVGSGPPVVCLHGAMGGYDQSLLLAQTIGDAGYRYLCMSRPGYLGTPLSAGRSSAEQGDSVAIFLDALGVQQAGVLAVSGGGPCAIQFALRHAHRCLGLVLVSTCATRMDTKIPLSFKLMLLMARWPWFARKLRQKAGGNLQEQPRTAIRDPEILARTMADAEAWPLFSRMMSSTWEHLPERIPGARNDIQVSRNETYALEGIHAPALIVHGTEDQLLPFSVHAKMLAERIPKAELLPVPGGEHVAIFTHRACVREEVRAFMRTHFPGQA